MPSSACKKKARSEEHTSELQSHDNIVCRLLLEKKKIQRGVLDGADCATATSERLRGFRARRLLTTKQPTTNPTQPRCHLRLLFFFFFFNDPAPPEIYTLSLHDALPINDTATTEIYTLSLHDALPISVVAVS